MNNYLQCTLKHMHIFFKEKVKLCLPVQGATKIESGYNTCCISCVKWIVLMNWSENNFWLLGCQKFNFQPNHTCETRLLNMQ